MRPTPKIGFTRWYDTQPELSQAVRRLEQTPVEHRKLICDCIIDLQGDLTGNTEDYGLKKLGHHKVIGLMKSKAKRRWYDREPHVHRAFNVLYMMDDRHRYEAAIRILISIEALQEHETKFLSSYQPHMLADSTQGPSPYRRLEQAQKHLVKSVFFQPTSNLLKKITFTRVEAPPLSANSTSSATSQTNKETNTPTGKIIDDNSGMKLGGVQAPQGPRGLI